MPQSYGFCPSDAIVVPHGVQSCPLALAKLRCASELGVLNFELGIVRSAHFELSIFDFRCLYNSKLDNSKLKIQNSQFKIVIWSFGHLVKMKKEKACQTPIV
ncbi:hypothetical protein [Prevotella sp.]|uniref:hypothetical protein n=1 Tax=Prevotella sp. TaxID=59823 RepID=UPI0040275405